VLDSVNKRRKTLNLNLLEEWTAETKLDEGLIKESNAPQLNKESALRDASAFSEAISSAGTLGKVEAENIVSDLSKLEADPSLLAALREGEFIELGLGLVPISRTQWMRRHF
jgi:hypothetical protein